jgi:hypothetical protein
MATKGTEGAKIETRDFFGPQAFASFALFVANPSV